MLGGHSRSLAGSVDGWRQASKRSRVGGVERRRQTRGGDYKDQGQKVKVKEMDHFIPGNKVGDWTFWDQGKRKEGVQYKNAYTSKQ